MKRISLLFLAVSFLCLGTSTPLTAAEIIPAGDFLLNDYYGKVVVIDFWASWCEPCAKALPWLAEMQQRYGKEGLQVITVNLDQVPKDAEKLASLLPEGVVQVSDPKGNLAAEFKLEGLPSTFLLTREGDPAGSHVGFLPKEIPEREAEILEILKKGSEHARGF